MNIHLFQHSKGCQQRSVIAAIRSQRAPPSGVGGSSLTIRGVHGGRQPRCTEGGVASAIPPSNGHQAFALGILENHWNNTLGMGSADHGIRIELKEPHDFKDIKSFIAYPMAYVGKTSIGALQEWTKYDVIFNTCPWFSPRPRLQGGIGHRMRAFQPSRALSKIMNPHPLRDGFIHIETTLSRKT